MTSEVSICFLVEFVLFKYRFHQAKQIDNSTHFAGAFEEVCKKLKIPYTI